MDMKTVCSLFSLFSGREDVSAWLPVITSVMGEITSQLRENANAEDTRLCYLAAACANLRYRHIQGNQDKPIATYAGTIAKQSDDAPQILSSSELVSYYRALCADLLKESDFFFFRTEG